LLGEPVNVAGGGDEASTGNAGIAGIGMPPFNCYPEMIVGISPGNNQGERPTHFNMQLLPSDNLSVSRRCRSAMSWPPVSRQAGSAARFRVTAPEALWTLAGLPGLLWP
jgi:hypothetical protein